MIRVHAPLHTKVSTAIQLDGQTKARDVTAHFQCENRWHAFARTHTHARGRQRCLMFLSLSLSPKYQSCSVFIRSGWKHLWVWRHRLHSWHCCLLHTVNGYIFLCSCLPPRWASSSSGLRFIGGPQGQSSLWLADQTMTRTISITTCPGELLKCLTTTGVWQSGSCLTKCLTVNLASQYLFSHRTTRATKLPVLPSLNPGSETNY